MKNWSTDVHRWKYERWTQFSRFKLVISKVSCWKICK